MKSFNIKNLITMSKIFTVAMMFVASTVAYAGDRSDGEHGHHHRWSGWHKVAENDADHNGHHYGHHNEKGKHKGFKKKRNHRHADTDSDSDDTGANQDSGVTLDLTVNDYAINPGTSFNATYNSLQTVQDVLTDLLGDSTAGYVLQVCYQISAPGPGGTSNNCTPGESLDPLATDLTLDAAGLVADPVVYLVKL